MHRLKPHEQRNDKWRYSAREPKKSNLTLVTVRSADNLLIESILKGNERAFETLYNKYSREFLLICMRYSKSNVEAEDFLQDSFITIYKDLSKFKPEIAGFRTWARRVVVNVCLQRVRKLSYKMVIEDIQTIKQQPNEIKETPLESLSLKEMTSLIQQLPSGYRTVFNLYVIDGFDHKEIAEKLNITASTSRTQLMKAKKILRQQYLLNDEYIILPKYG